MSQDDPFAFSDSDKTIMIATSEGSAASRQDRRASSDTRSNLSEIKEIEDSVIGGLNPLIAAANPLLNLAPRLRATLQHPDPFGLRDHIAEQIKAFDTRARAAGVVPEKIIIARYCLCTLLDEAAASTPWGRVWAKQSLLVMFHNDARGGERFFQMLTKLAEKPKENRDLLELMYICLALGFEGRYRIIDNGRAQLDILRERLARFLKKEQGEYERDLSPHWETAQIEDPKPLFLPVWVLASICGLVMLLIYSGFSFSLGNVSDPVFAQIQSIRVKNPLPKPVSVPSMEPRLAEFLSNEINHGLVAVRDEKERSVVVLKGDGLFAPGGAAISERFLPVLKRVANALNEVPGQVKVTGYTDDQPIRSVQYPSNWHLSQERARSVMKILAENGTQSNRIVAEGRADAEPVANNSTSAGRARNRRVEITLYTQRTNQPLP